MRVKAYRRDVQDKKEHRLREIIVHRHSGPLVG